MSDGSEQIYLYPRYALPVDPAQSLLGHPIARWYASGGTQGKAPKDPQLLKALELFRSAPGKKAEERHKIAQEIWKILVDEQYSIGTVGQSPATLGVRIVSKRMGNIPARQVNAQHARTPGSSHPPRSTSNPRRASSGSAPVQWSVASAPLMPWIDGGRACPVQSASENAVDKIPD